MTRFPFTLILGALPLLTASSQTPAARKPEPPSKPVVAVADSSDDESDPENAKFLFGLAGGALSYSAGRDEQSVGAIVRWAPVNWLSLSATPTSVRAREVAVGTVPATTRSGLTDLPLEVTLAHRLEGAAWSPSFAASLGVTLPVGDTASGLGSGEVGYSASGGVGFSPAERLWVHLGAGRSLTRFSVQSAFSSGTGWGDASAGIEPLVWRALPMVKIA